MSDPTKALRRISYFMGEQTERENVVAWLRKVGDSKAHGTDWRAYYEAADLIEAGAHEPTTPHQHGAGNGEKRGG